MSDDDCRSPIGLDCCSCCLDLANGCDDSMAGSPAQGLGTTGGLPGSPTSPTVNHFRQLRNQLMYQNLNTDKLNNIMRQDSLESVVRDPCFLLNEGICNSNIDQTMLSILLFFHSVLKWRWKPSSWVNGLYQNDTLLNGKKSLELRICFSRNPPQPAPLFLRGREVPVMATATKLGFHLNSDLSRDTHIKQVVRKASKLSDCSSQTRPTPARTASPSAPLWSVHAWTTAVSFRWAALLERVQKKKGPQDHLRRLHPTTATPSSSEQEGTGSHSAEQRDDARTTSPP